VSNSKLREIIGTNPVTPDYKAANSDYFTFSGVAKQPEKPLPFQSPAK
jgi:hypothetical protein